jgi:opacity protein-like surface antigen
MLMSSTHLSIILAVVFLGITNSGQAVGMASYVGIGLGNTSAEVDGTSGQVTTSGAGYRLVAGSQIAQTLSVETEYVDLGTFAGPNFNVSAKALGVSGVLTMPVTGMLSIYGKAGLARVETTVAMHAIAASTTPLSDAVVGMSLGYGIQIDVAPNASIRLAWDRYKSSALAGPFTDRVNMNSSGLFILRF